MPSLSPDYLARLRFDGQQLAMLRALGEHRGKQQFHLAQPPEVLSDLRQIAVAESAAASNRLEGVVVGAQRLKSLLHKNAAPRSRSEQEVAGYRDALGWIHDSGAQRPFSEAGILQLHGILCRYRAQPGGHWKSAADDIIERRAEGNARIRWRPVAAHRAPMVLSDMVARHRSALDRHWADPLVLVPLAILDFFCIHPFPDGNGRMARLLTLQLLSHCGYAVGRFISLERIFEEAKAGYGETLQASAQGWHEDRHDVAPWLNYFWRALLRAYGEFEERVGSIVRGRGAKGERVRAEILARHRPFSISGIEAACPGISRDMVRVVLRSMKAQGLIAPTGKGRGAKWQHTGAKDAA
ncbi:Fic family protein [Verminephrobacter eiseniae]|uniref:Filamentation induced by cAMP protein Fic n=1 Tax=Verminephrobacter eiseniae (strain EF01-2) TaxID=391735 RepID=A1WNZ5_VEREI|nr:Fic family protein [Verminephrobacter eiseniae]ABM59352.1 filamentation induced by cAMP protein Fic [Verminephrobacter eiseniae EF01-2]MCW5284880.1 Fic family protein [Verminephrobacter eiseniae]MCW5302588.1 Fic family protein [Verminephrobacter eiseniae]MCW8182787.1 Fic family protein [Verminephrobacter eiseniae]MCW8190824.1 Fic family protein [Verminephrobacter eiseniae]